MTRESLAFPPGEVVGCSWSGGTLRQTGTRLAFAVITFKKNVTCIRRHEVFPGVTLMSLSHFTEEILFPYFSLYRWRWQYPSLPLDVVAFNPAVVQFIFFLCIFPPSLQVKACVSAGAAHQQSQTVKLHVSIVYFGLKHIWAVFWLRLSVLGTSRMTVFYFSRP